MTAAKALVSEWNRMGSQMRFFVGTLAGIPDALMHYRGELLRVIAQMGLGTGVLAVIGGTVAIVGFLAMTTGAIVAVQGYNQFASVGVEALTGFASAFFNTREIQPGTVMVALAATVGAGTTAALGAMRINEEIEVRFGDGKTYYAEFANVSNLRTGKLVRIAGVEVGKVTRISINPDATVRVQFTADNSVTLTRGTRAVIRYDNLFGDRYLALEEGAGGLAVLRPGHTIPLARTQPALDLDALIGGFKPLFRALNPEQVNALSEQLLHAFAGQGPTIGSLLAQSAAVTNTLADRDRLIGQVITNLNVVLGSLGAHTDRLDQAVTSLSALIHRLAQRKTDISNAVAYTNAAAGSVADLLSQARAPLAKVVRETDRVAGIAAADHDYLDNLLNTLPDKYQALVRQGMYGDFFAFYLCDVVLKVNGKGGQPVYIKLAGQDSGRCAPK